MNTTKTLNLHAMLKPKSADDILVLLKEFKAELQSVQEHFDHVTHECEAAGEHA